LLSPRERCLRAVELEVPDRVPLTLRIRREPLARLKAALGIEDSERLHRFLGIDVRSTGLALRGGYTVEGGRHGEQGWIVGREGEYEVERNIFGYETIWRRPGTYTYTFRSYPLQKVSLDEYVWPEVDEGDASRVVGLRRRYEDYCLCGSVTHMWEVAWKLTGFSQFMVAMYRDPALVNGVLDGLNRIRLRQAKILGEAGVDVIYDGDDVGTQTSMMLSPELFRRYLKPRYLELGREIHRRGAHFFFHSDGYIEPVIPDLIEAGVDILNPVQPECMDPARIKGLYGDRLCLDGTISIQRTMPFGTPRDVAQEVRERIRTVGPAGLILGPSHSMQPDVPVENILTLYEAAKKYGKFPAETGNL